MQHAPLQSAGIHVQLDVELAQLVLHVRSAQASEDRIVDQPRAAQRVDEIEFHLHSDRVLMVDEPAPIDHALQRRYAPLEPGPHLIAVPCNEGGRFEAVTHGAPPRGSTRRRLPLQKAHLRKIGAIMRVERHFSVRFLLALVAGHRLR
jgi:hypothetical protein